MYSRQQTGGGRTIRTLFTLLAALALFAACSPAEDPETLLIPTPDTDDQQPIRVLAVTATHGFRHSPAIDAAKALFQDLSSATEFRFTVTESLADLERLDGFDVVFFANSTLRLAPEEPAGLTAAQRNALLTFIRGGGGFAGAHSALDACYGWAEYRALVGGGLFHSHPWTQTVRIRNDAPSHPITAHLGNDFELKDEIYVLDADPSPGSSVLLSLDVGSVDLGRLPEEVARSHFPMSWTRSEGDGRIFITKLGHFPHVWLDEGYQEHLLQGLRYAAGRLSPNEHSQDTERGAAS